VEILSDPQRLLSDAGIKPVLGSLYCRAQRMLRYGTTVQGPETLVVNHPMQMICEKITTANISLALQKNVGYVLPCAKTVKVRNHGAGVNDMRSQLSNANMVFKKKTTDNISLASQEFRTNFLQNTQDLKANNFRPQDFPNFSERGP
jgi:hypothetical protein